METSFWVFVGLIDLLSLALLALVLRNARHFAGSNIDMLGEEYAPFIRTRAFRLLQGLYTFLVLALVGSSGWLFFYHLV